MISSPQSSSQLVFSYHKMILHSHSYSVQEPSLKEFSVFFYIIAVYQEITACYLPNISQISMFFICITITVVQVRHHNSPVAISFLSVPMILFYSPRVYISYHRVILIKYKSDHVTSLLKALQWPPLMYKVKSSSLAWHDFLLSLYSSNTGLTVYVEHFT